MKKTKMSMTRSTACIIRSRKRKKNRTYNTKKNAFQKIMQGPIVTESNTYQSSSPFTIYQNKTKMNFGRKQKKSEK